MDPPVTDLTDSQAEARRASVGYNEVPEVRPSPLSRLARKFVGAIPALLEAALLLELVLERWVDASVIAALLVFNAGLSFVQESRTQHTLDLLRERLPVSARVRRGGTWRKIPARELVPGDLVELRMGDQVPADLRLVGGSGVRIDQSMLTGESEAVDRSAGADVYAGTTVTRGEATGTVTAIGASTRFGRTAEIVRKAEAPGRLERLVLGIVRYLVYYDLLLLGAVTAYGYLTGIPWPTLLPFALILLIVSIPVALPATFTLANAVGASDLAGQGVLVTGLSAVEEAATMTTLFTDKTGTLTQNRLTLKRAEPGPGESEATLLAYAASVADAATLDAIDAAILQEAQRRKIDPYPTRARVPFTPQTKRSEATIDRHGQTVRVVLGSPLTLAPLCGRDPAEAAAEAEQRGRGGERVLAVAAGAAAPLAWIGWLILADPPRPTSAAVVRRLQELGIRVVMVTGDTRATAEAVAGALGIGTRVVDRTEFLGNPRQGEVLAGVYPEDKYAVVRALQGAGEVVGMTGDGVNDAAAIRQADVGIAVDSATDVAKSAARLVLTEPGIDGIVPAVEAGRRVYRRLLTYTLVKLTKVVEIATLLAIGLLVTGEFVTTPQLILFLVFANDFVTMSLADDDAEPSPEPNRWDVRMLVGVAATLGAAWLALSFGIFYAAGPLLKLSLGSTQTLIFVDQVYLVQATVLLLRTPGSIWRRRPGRWVGLSTIGVVGAASVLALAGVAMAPVTPEALGVLAGAVVALTALLDRTKGWLMVRLSGPAPRPPVPIRAVHRP
jgi:H+-transporting ATPase